MGIPIKHEPPLLIRYSKEFGVVLDVISKLIIHHPQQKTDARWEEGDGAVLSGVFTRGVGLSEEGNDTLAQTSRQPLSETFDERTS
jgi:hypothetical protein